MAGAKVLAGTSNIKELGVDKIAIGRDKSSRSDGGWLCFHHVIKRPSARNVKTRYDFG